MQIPLSAPDITTTEIDAVLAVLSTPNLSLGPQLLLFERRIAEFTRLPHAIAVSSGTAGLHLCVRALGLGPGDEVLVPSFTFIAAANVMRYEGAIPVFVDIDADTLNLDTLLLERALTSRTRAIMVVHTFGRPADLVPILAFAERHNLLVIEDACEALGATYDGRPVGGFGHAAVFAFYPNKQITTGEGGVIVTRDPGLAREMRALRNQGRYDSDAWHQHSIVGFNYRLSDLNCALGVAQMQRLPEILSKRATVAQTYAAALRDIPGVILPIASDAHSTTSWFVYVIRLPPAPGLRDRVLGRMAAAGIQCGRYFAPVHQQPAYANWPQPHPLPITEAESLRTLALPFFSNLSPDGVACVAENLKRSLAQR